MASDFDSDALIAALAAATTAEDRFAALTKGLGSIGIDIVNYGFFDASAAERAATDIQFMTTMSSGWMDYYHGDGLAASDPHVLRVQAGRITPYLWGSTIIDRLDDPGERRVALEGIDNGLKTGLFVPLASPLEPFTPVAGIALASALSEAEFGKLFALHGAALTQIAYIFHHASIRGIWLDRIGAKRLSDRERDCLRHLADGRRQDAIADRLGIARVTVEMHLRSARQKLGARTLHEAIARALIFGEISRS